MAETARPRPNHYQILGVSPAASADEIAHAFARESSVFRPHVFGGLTEVCVAYEVLRDPTKRQAYDESIGLTRKPDPNRWPGVRGTATAEVMMRAAAPVERPPLAASPPKPEPVSSKPALPLGPGADSNIRPEPSIGRSNPPYVPFEEMLEGEVRPIDWKRTGLTLGGFVVAACAMGGLAGWWSVSDMSEAAEPANSVSVPLPAAKPAATAPAPETLLATAPVPVVAEARPDRPRPAIAAASRAVRPTVPEPVAVEARFQQDEPGQASAEPAVDEAPVAPTAAAAMPLPNRVVARTIERIGYSCGSVASTAPVEGAPGVYTVSCTSGQSYRASPVNGRYRFRRLGR